MTEPLRVNLDAFNDIPAPARGNGRADRNSWLPTDLTLLPARPPDQPTLGQLGLVYPGKRHVFSGPQESAKTLVAYIIAIQVVRHGGRALILDFEMGPWDARNRLQELGATTDELKQLPYLAPNEPATKATVQQLLAFDPSLVIVDAAAGAYELQGLDDNKRGDAERVASLYIKPFWEAGIATIIIDHVVKNTETRGKYAIGSERKTGGADVHLGFETITPIQRGTHGLYKIVTHKDRGGYLKRGTLAELHLTSHQETNQITWDIQEGKHTDPTIGFRPTFYMQRVSEYLERYPGGHTSRNTIETDVKGQATYIRQALDQLIHEGYATEKAGVRGARLVTSLKPFRDNNPSSNTENHPNQHPQNDLVPTSSAPRPDELVSPRPTSSPPYRGTTVARDDEEKTTSSHTDDDIPF